jgi:hypothetical protein
VYERDLHNRNLGGVVRGAAGRGGAVDPETGQPARAGGAGRGRGAAPVTSVGGNPIAPTFPATSKYRVSNRRLWYNWGYINEGQKVDQGAAHHQGHPDRGRRDGLREAGRGRDHRVESWRPLNGLRTLDA